MSYAITDQVRELKTGNATAKAVLLRLADYANDVGECFPSTTRIADELELSRQAVSNAIKRLESIGLVKISRESGRHNCYQVTPENYNFVDKKHDKPVNDVYKSSEMTRNPSLRGCNPSLREPVNLIDTNHHITINNHQSSSNTREEKISQPPAQFVQYHNFDLEKISVIELGQKYSTLKFDFIELSKPRHPELDQHDLENLFDEFGDWFASPNDFGKQSSKTAQKWAVSWLTWVNNNKYKIIARKAKMTANEQSVSKPQTSAQPSAYQAKQDNVNRWKSYGQQAANQFDESRIIDVVPDNPKNFLIEGVGHA